MFDSRATVNQPVTPRLRKLLLPWPQNPHWMFMRHRRMRCTGAIRPSVDGRSWYGRSTIVVVAAVRSVIVAATDQISPTGQNQQKGCHARRHAAERSGSPGALLRRGPPCAGLRTLASAPRPRSVGALTGRAGTRGQGYTRYFYSPRLGVYGAVSDISCHALLTTTNASPKTQEPHQTSIRPSFRTCIPKTGGPPAIAYGIGGSGRNLQCGGSGGRDRGMTKYLP